MPVSIRKSSARRASAQKKAARKAMEVAKVLNAFAATLTSLDTSVAMLRKPVPTPRNWWKLQAGRFKSDPTFHAFVAQVQAARKAED